MIALLGVLILACLVFNIARINKGYTALNEAMDEYMTAQNDAAEMNLASDYLTDQVRQFVLTGDRKYLDGYFTEANETKRRDRAVESIREDLKDLSEESTRYLELSLMFSNELMEKEYYAFRLAAEAFSLDVSSLPEEIQRVSLSEADEALDDEAKKALARDIVYGPGYQSVKDEIYLNVRLCTEKLIYTMKQREETISANLKLLLRVQYLLIAVVLAVIIFYLLFTEKLIIRPITEFTRAIKNHAHFDYSGVRELTFVSESYNEMLDITKEDTSRLSYEATHDPLTGVLNRAAYEDIMERHGDGRLAFLIIDIDYFKQINDTYGHNVGDKALKRVADALKKSFRSEDFICRIGGDEFVVIMINAGSELKALVASKIESIAKSVKDEKDGMPGITLSIGVAFSDRKDPSGTIFEDADKALYRAKEKGRNGFEFY